MVKEATATVVTGDQSANSASVEVDKPVRDETQNPVAASGTYLKSIVDNPLEQYASFSPLWTFACLDQVQYNNPASYRTEGGLKNIIFSSAGRFDAGRVNTSAGAPEFFIDDVQISSVISPTPSTGNSLATKITFKIFEPYSMGLFLQSMQVAARIARYPNYLSAPYVLKLEFLGYDELGQILSPGNSVYTKSKYFVIKIVKSSFTVKESGSEYDVEAIPFNHQALNDVTTTVFNDIAIEAGSKGTVAEVLNSSDKSLTKALNEVEQNLKKNGRIRVADIYDIQFPTTASRFNSVRESPVDQGASKDPNAPAPKSVGSGITETTVELDINPIGAANFGFDQSSGGIYPFLKENEQLDESGVFNKDGLVINPDKRMFQFAQGQNILNIIERIITSSTYASQATEPQNKVDGFMLYYRVDVQTEFLEFDDLIGDYARKITFRVIPYFVHESIFSNPNSSPKGYKELQNRVVKNYEYIYTGQNSNILNFDIKINNQFYVPTSPTPESQNQTAADPGSSGTAPKGTSQTATGRGASPGAMFGNLGRSRPLPDPELLKDSAQGGAGQKTVAIQVAEAFHRAFITGSAADLVTTTLEILGDPYWLSDSGMANYFSPPTNVLSQITEDASMSHEAAEVYTYITFRTAGDIDEVSGLSAFPIVGSDSPFSGIYRITKVESVFNGGVFTQRLHGVRMIGQSQDFTAAPIEVIRELGANDQNIAAIEITEPREIPTAISNSASEQKGPPTNAIA
jgi:hypothetical protein